MSVCTVGLDRLPLPMFSLASYVFVGLWATGNSQEDSLSWPECVANDKVPDAAKPITADVREFIKHPDNVRHREITFRSDRPLGMALREKPHDKGEMVEEVQAGSQALLAGVQRGWIITQINGKVLSPQWTLKDVVNNVTAAQKAGSNLTVKYDVRAAVDCLHADCNSSDRFPADTEPQCAIACERTPNCEWWSWHSEGSPFKLCYLHGEANGLADAPGMSTGMRGCAPVPKISKSNSWPTCAIPDADLHFGNPVFADVNRFIVERASDVRHKDLIFTAGSIGMILREDPHDLGEVVSEVVPNSQADRLGVRSGWIIKEINGKPFDKKEGILDVNADFEAAKHKFSTLTVNFDVKTHADCSKGNCKHSEKFPATDPSICADACYQVPECDMWSFSTDEEDTMCFFRSDYVGLRAEVGSYVGSTDCSPNAVWYNQALLLLFFVALTLSALGRRVLGRHLVRFCNFWKPDKLLD